MKKPLSKIAPIPFKNKLIVKPLKRLNSNFDNKEKIILRDFLAMERTTLANERTLFSYIRSGIYLILAAIAFIQLEGFKPMRWVGFTLLALSLFLFIFGIVRYRVLQKKLRGFYTTMEKEQDPNEKDKSEE